MGLKLYLASSFDLDWKVDALAKKLESMGHTITVKWWSKDGFDLRDKKADTKNPGAFYREPVIGAIFRRDYQGVIDADAFVLIADDVMPRKFNGANIELGIAIASHKPVYSLGVLENSALYFPLTRCVSEHDLFRRLNSLHWGRFHR